jgi:hypothetical protein
MADEERFPMPRCCLGACLKELKTKASTMELLPLIKASDEVLDKCGRFLERRTGLGYILFGVFASLGLSLFFYCPSLWLMAKPYPGSFEWSRALAYLDQCENPFSRDLSDVGLYWRLLPPLITHALGLKGFAVFVLPWVGLLVLFAQVLWLGLRETGDRLLALLVCSLLATTTCTITVSNFLGFNDAWYVVFLVAAACSRSSLVLVLACLLGPWVDERFILGLPMALGVRLFFRGKPAPGQIWATLMQVLPGLGLYVSLRLLFSLLMPAEGLDTYFLQLIGQTAHTLPWLPFGWFMALRAAWLPLLLLLALMAQRNERWVLWLSLLCSFGVCLALLPLSSDLGRAPTLLIPMVLVGSWAMVSQWGLRYARLVLAALLLCNLLLPLLCNTYDKSYLMRPALYQILLVLR